MTIIRRVLRILRNGISDAFYADVPLTPKIMRQVYQEVICVDIFIHWDYYYYTLTYRYSCQNYLDRLALHFSIYLSLIKCFLRTLFVKYELVGSQIILDEWVRIIPGERSDLRLGVSDHLTMKLHYALNLDALHFLPLPSKISKLFMKRFLLEVSKFKHLKIPKNIELVEFDDIRNRALIWLAEEANSSIRIVYLASASPHLPLNPKECEKDPVARRFETIRDVRSSNKFISMTPHELRKNFGPVGRLIVVPTFPSFIEVENWCQNLMKIIDGPFIYSTHPSYKLHNIKISKIFGLNYAIKRQVDRYICFNSYIGGGSTLLDYADKRVDKKVIRVAFNDYQAEFIDSISSGVNIVIIDPYHYDPDI